MSNVIQKFHTPCNENQILGEQEWLTKVSPRILFFDIESAPLQAWIWQTGKQYINHKQLVKDHSRYGVICIAYCWNDNKPAQTLDWGYEHQNTSRLIKEFDEIIKQADMVIGKNCVAAHHKVLKSDLTWVEAGSLKPGDKLFAFEEYASKGRYRDLCESEVLENTIIEQPCLKVILSNGEEIITSIDHPWLSLGVNYNESRWRPSAQLKPGHRIIKYMNVWGQDNTYQAGWLAGFIEGEGTISDSGTISFCQKEGAVFNQALSYCSNMQIEMMVPYKRLRNEKNPNHSDVMSTQVLGGKWSSIELSGKIGLTRIMTKMSKHNKYGWGKLIKSSSSEILTVISVVDAGMQKVATMSTSTKTFFAEGYAMHNSDRFDVKMINAARMFSGLPGMPEWSKYTDDLEKQMRKHFRMPSQSLDYISHQLGLGGKIKMEFADWIDIVEKNENGWKAFKRMIKYNKKDVVDTRKLWYHLSEHFEPKFNMATYIDERLCCRHEDCGSTDLKKNGTRYSGKTRYQEYHCRSCGRYAGRSPINSNGRIS